MTQQDTQGARQYADAPIYARLVKERGDVVEDARRVAAQALRQADPAVHFNSLKWARA